MNIEQDRFVRLKALIGQDGFERLANAFVAVVGLGAVGSYALEALARAGVGRLRLVDFDQIRYSNFNRQLLAIESNLGKPKTQAAVERVLLINPNCSVDTLQVFLDGQTVGKILEGPPDLVIDAIDAVGPKTLLLYELLRRQIPAVSSMGAALRTDPTLIRIGPLESTINCPLARRLRKRLRSMGVDISGVTAVYSIEPLQKDVYRPKYPQPDDITFQRGRPRRPLGSLPTLTGIFGLACAQAAIEIILGRSRGNTIARPSYNE